MGKPSFEIEEKIWNKGYKYIIGIDEVGRGSFAGPLVAAAVVLPIEDFTGRESINDSKLLTKLKRKKISEIVIKNAIAHSITKVSVRYINRYGVGKANKKAFREVIKMVRKKLNHKKIFVLVDGFNVKYLKGIGLKNQKAIIKGDKKSLSIAAASVIAKVYRDDLMSNLPKRYNKYKFSIHKGYGTKLHQTLIKKYGLSVMHRKSFNLTKFSSPD